MRWPTIIVANQFTLNTTGNWNFREQKVCIASSYPIRMKSLRLFLLDQRLDSLVEAFDLVLFGEGIDASNLSFARIGASNDLAVRLIDDDGNLTGDEVLIEGQFAALNTLAFGVVWLDRIERFGFSDYGYLSEGDIMQRTLQEARTDGVDAIYGFHNRDRIDGGFGNDLLSGGSLGDTYVFGRGYGHDVIEDNLGDFLSESYDIVEFRPDIAAADIVLSREGASATVSLHVAGTDDILTLQNQFQLTSTIVFGDYYFDNVDEFRFTDGSGTVWTADTLARRLLAEASTDGDDIVYGFDRADTLDGGAGNDRMEGGGYSDTYLFAAGYGHDTIHDAGPGGFVAPGHDRVLLQDIAFGDIAISRDRNDLIFTLFATGETITFDEQFDRVASIFDEHATAIEEFHFSDQLVVFTDLLPDDIDLVGTEGDDILWGTHFAETIDGRGGNDLLIGSSDGDSYRFDAGYGSDIIRDIQESRKWFNDDHVYFGNGITLENVRFARSGDDLLITIEDTTDTLLIEGQFGSLLWGVEHFHFDAGPVWTIADIKQLLQIAGGGEGDDVLVGFTDQPNVLDGRQGDDVLYGGDFADTYLFGLG